MLDAEFTPVAVEQINPDFGLLAQSYGCGYARPGDIRALERACAGALDADGPTIIEVTRAVLG